MKALLRRLHGPVYERRLKVLCGLLKPRLTEGETLLDVGCGSGELGRRLGEECGVAVEGLEVQPRADCRIPVTEYDGSAFPFPDNAFDTVLLADILHHEPTPAEVLREAGRVARKQVIVKDHKVDGPAAWARIAFIDWAANVGYDVPCLYQYYTGDEWADLFESCGLEVQTAIDRIDLYPPGLNLMFGKRLQYLAVVSGESRKGSK